MITKPKMLLHSCCGPCSTAVINRLKNDYNIVVYYCNPNIFPHEEYQHRLAEQIRYLNSQAIDYIVGDYSPDGFDKILYDEARKIGKTISYFATQKEGDRRCELCFRFRLLPVAKLAKDNNYDIFCTTLTVSPHKNANTINHIGKELEKQFSIKYLESDFKKLNGYLESIQMSKAFGLYRQGYCGCKYSLLNKH